MNKAAPETTKILLVEDSYSVAALIKNAIASAFSGVEVVTVDNRADAAEKLKSEPFSVVIMDNTFPHDAKNTPSPTPESPGIGLIAALREGKLGETNQYASLLFQTGDLSEETENAAMNAGANACIQKKGHKAFISELVTFIEQCIPAHKNNLSAGGLMR